MHRQHRQSDHNPSTLIDLLLSQNIYDHSESSVFTAPHESYISRTPNLGEEFLDHFSQPLMPIIYPSKQAMNSNSSTARYVQVDVFEQVINKLWNQIQKMMIIIDKLQERSATPPPSKKTSKKPTEESLRSSRVDADANKLKKEMQSLQSQFQAMDSQTLKFYGQGKDLQGKLELVQEKVKNTQGSIAKYEEQVTMLNHKFSITKEECEERISQIQDAVRVSMKVSNDTSAQFEDLKQWILTLDQDMVRIFTQMKSLLEMDYQVNEHSRELNGHQNQIQQLRRAITELSNYLSAQY